MMHINVKAFHVPTPPMKIYAMWLMDIYFINNISNYKSLFIILYFHVWWEFFIWYTFIYSFLIKIMYRYLFLQRSIFFEMRVHISNQRVQFLSCLSINVFGESVVGSTILSKLMYSCPFISCILLYCCWLLKKLMNVYILKTMLVVTLIIMQPNKCLHLYLSFEKFMN
jgi:hypothetical protein